MVYESVQVIAELRCAGNASDARRRAIKIKKQYPQLRLCLCMDALYANGTVFTTYEQNYWKYTDHGWDRLLAFSNLATVRYHGRRRRLAGVIQR